MLWYKMYLKDERYNKLNRAVICSCGARLDSAKAWDEHLTKNNDGLHFFATWL